MKCRSAWQTFAAGGAWARVAVAAVLIWCVCALLLEPPVLLGQARREDRWVATWATALVARPQPAPGADAARGAINLKDQTLRQIVRANVGGDRVRVMLSNLFGTARLDVGAVRVGLRAKDAAIASTSARVVTFGGRLTVDIAPGAEVVSDPVDLNVPPLADLVIDLYLPGDTAASPVTFHNGARQTNYLSSAGNHAGAVELPVAGKTQSWFFVGRVDVAAREPAGVVVAIGASLVDGNGSTADANKRWTDHLARRLQAASMAMSVLNLGIGGNRLLTNTPASAGILQRFERHVLDQPGVTHVIVVPPRIDDSETVDALIAAHRQLIQRAHGRGLRIYASPNLPSEGSQGWTPKSEETRRAINQWIHTSREYDGVIDFDAVVRDPANPSKLLPRYDSGDHLHPNDDGYEAMANAIDLALFRAGRTPRTF